MRDFGGRAFVAKLLTMLVSSIGLLSINLVARQPSGDEASTLMAISHSWSALPKMFAHVDAVHAIYYVLLKVWVQIWPGTFFPLRFFSVVSIALAAAVLAVIVKMWTKDDWAGLAAGVIFLALPRTIAASTDGRSFAFTCLLTAVTLLLLSRTYLHQRSWILAGIAIGVAISTFVASAAFYVTIGAAALVAKKWRSLMAIGLGLLLASPVAIISKRQVKQISWIEASTITDLLIFPARVFVPRAVGYLLVLWLLLLATILCLAIVSSPKLRPLVTVGFALAVLFPIEIILVGMVTPMYHQRYATIATLGVALLAGAALANRKTAIILATVAAFIALTIRPGIALRAAPTPSMDEVVTCIKEVRQPGDQLWLLQPNLFTVYPELAENSTDLTLVERVQDSPQLRGVRQPVEKVTDRVAKADRIVGSVPKESNQTVATGIEFITGQGLPITSDRVCGTDRIIVFERNQ